MFAMKYHEALYNRVRSCQILGAFSERHHEDIWSRVLSATVDQLDPSLFSFFKDLNYHKIVTDSVKRLFPPLPHGAVYPAIEDVFSDASYRGGQCAAQESESSCVFRPGSLADQVPAMPKRQKLSTKPITGKADKIVSCEFATFAYSWMLQAGHDHEDPHISNLSTSAVTSVNVFGKRADQPHHTVVLLSNSSHKA
ncbi:hypothetical protein B0J11DRAFT_512165 [Dendryphion nanum]|uniref:Uncharacterized protein n=1 Tax=Dendryphion nanum TaxID=256645 RepID=A0A9P9D0T4_9PLEO|nr:hypothetical protein B0J11DRAFT_512165 [Dendryphion nanum]